MSDIPIDHIQRLAAHGDDPQMPGAVRISAKIVQGWLDENEDPAADYKDACAALQGVMSKLSELPMHSADFLGDDLHKKVSRVLGYEDEDEDEDEDTDDDSEEDE